MQRKAVNPYLVILLGVPTLLRALKVVKGNDGHWETLSLLNPLFFLGGE